MTSTLEREAATLAADRLKVFAQPQRLMILSALVDRELSVGAIDAATGIRQPALSQQLAELRRAELVVQRRVAKQVLYRLADDRTTSIVRFLASVFGDDREPTATLLTPESPPPVTGAVQAAAMFVVMDA